MRAVHDSLLLKMGSMTVSIPQDGSPLWVLFSVLTLPEMMLSWQTTLLALADTAYGEDSRSARARNEWSLRVWNNYAAVGVSFVHVCPPFVVW